MPAHHTARVGFLMLGDSVSHISLRHLYYMESERDEDFIAHVISISTSLSISQSDQEDTELASLDIYMNGVHWGL